MQVCLQNLHLYNEGCLLFKWVELPLTSKELVQAFDDIKISHDEVEHYDEHGDIMEEYHIADWEDCPFEVSEYSNIHHLNELAEFYDNLDGVEQEVFEHCLKNERMDFEEAKDVIEDHEFIYIEGDNDYDFAENYINEMYCGIKNMPIETLIEYFDFDRFGESLSYDFTQTENGYVQVR